MYAYRYTVSTRMTCIKMVSEESHFNVSLTMRDKVTRQCPQTTTFERERRAEAVSNRGPSAYQPYRLTARPNRLSRCLLLLLVAFIQRCSPCYCWSLLCSAVLLVVGRFYTALFSLLLVAFIQRCSPFSSRLTALLSRVILNE